MIAISGPHKTHGLYRDMNYIKYELKSALHSS
jgi:hypothetical protein